MIRKLLSMTACVPEHPDDRHVWMRHREQKLYTGSAKRRRQKGNDGKEERRGGKREGEKSGE